MKRATAILVSCAIVQLGIQLVAHAYPPASDDPGYAGAVVAMSSYN